MATLAERLGGLMREKELTPAQLAGASGLQLKTIYSYLDNYGAGNINNPRAQSLAQLADALDVSMDYLYGRVDVR